MSEIISLLESWRYAFMDEADLHDGIAIMLDLAKEAYQREHRMGTAGRIDFYLQNRKIGIEVKVGRSGGGPSAVIEQLVGYADHPDIEGLIVVTTRMAMKKLPATLRGKPLGVVVLWANGL